MTDRAELERRYRRLLACYPPAFRNEHEEEMLVVLLACARDGMRRPGVGDSANLLWHALGLRAKPRTPRSVPTVFWGVRLMILAGLLELVALTVVLATQGAVTATILRHATRVDATNWVAAMHGQVVSIEIGAPIALAGWLVLAWANDRGRRWGRAGAVALCVLNTLSLFGALSRHVATYARADLIIGAGLCAVALAATLAIISTDSNKRYERRGSGGDHVGRTSADNWLPGSEITGWN